MKKQNWRLNIFDVMRDRWRSCPGLPNNISWNLKQKKVISWVPVDQATGKKMLLIISSFCVGTFIESLFIIFIVKFALTQFRGSSKVYHQCKLSTEPLHVPNGSLNSHWYKQRPITHMDTLLLFSSEDPFGPANSADPDEMQHYKSYC